MVLSTYHEDAKIRVQKEHEKLQKQKQFKETTLNIDSPDDKSYLKNPFLDTNLRQLIDDFVMTWHKIFMDLLDFSNYENIKKQTEYWDIFYAIIILLKKVFWVNDRIFHIGIGFIIASFFVFFICVSQT